MIRFFVIFLFFGLPLVGSAHGFDSAYLKYCKRSLLPNRASTLVWPYKRNNDYSQNFNAAQTQYLKEKISNLVTIFHERGAREAFDQLTPSASLEQSGISISIERVGMPDVWYLKSRSTLLQAMENKSLTSGVSYNHEQRKITLVEFFLEEGTTGKAVDRGRASEEQLHIMQTIDEDNFLTAMEELIHAARFSFGALLSPYRMTDIFSAYPKKTLEKLLGIEGLLEEEIPLVFDALGLPVTPELVARYGRRGFLQGVDAKYGLSESLKRVAYPEPGLH